MVLNAITSITEEEAALYDRQIRLWGLEAQKRLRQSKVLIIGVRGLGAEICKNIILAGVQSVTLLDDGKVTEEDASSQFLAPQDKMGQNRAEASLERAKKLNPMVTVKADTDSYAQKEDDFFKHFDVICATGCPKKDMIKINNICRHSDTKFFAGDVYGFFGYMYADLQLHEFAVEEVVHVAVPKGDAKRLKIAEKETKTVKREMCYTPLQDALSVDFSLEKYKKRLKRMEGSYFLLRVLWEFEEKVGRRPSLQSQEEDLKELHNIRDEVLDKMGISKEKVPDSILKHVFGEMGSVCAIVGGVLAQEIVKAVSQKDTPHNNFFFFNPEKCLGTVECIGS